LMGCTNSFGGPLPEGWFDQRLDLARQILTRQRELGMRAVLPAFGGHVPDALAGPDTDRTTWQGFSTALLGPHEPRFAQIAESVARIQTELLGTDHDRKSTRLNSSHVSISYAVFFLQSQT